MLLSIDTGFASTKTCHDDGTGMVCSTMPTAVAQTAYSGITGVGTEQAVVTFADGSTLVAGNDAFDSPHLLENSSIEWLIRMMAVLVVTATGISGVAMEQVSRLAVGLPIQFWRENAGRVKSELACIKLANARYTPEVLVYAQGAGAFYYYCQLVCPPSAEKGLLIDLGGNTMQVIGYDCLKIKAALSRQYNHLGMLEPAKVLAATVAAEHAVSISTAKALKILGSGSFCTDGDCREISQKLVSQHMHLLVDRLEADFGERIREAHRLVLVGGGAYHLKDYLPTAWQAKAMLLRGAEYANAMGYYLQAR